MIVPSDYMISQLIEEEMLQPLDYDKIPNFSKIADRFKNLSYDPEKSLYGALHLGHPGHHLQQHHGGPAHHQLGRHV